MTGYLGDGIMAVFGVPDPMDDHADRALTSAVRMLDRMDDVNDTLAEALDGERLQMGIGLNAGPVTAGNLGSEQRLEYSVGGDAVNTASRIGGRAPGKGRHVPTRPGGRPAAAGYSSPVSTAASSPRPDTPTLR